MAFSAGDRMGLPTVPGRPEDTDNTIDDVDDHGALIAPKLARTIVAFVFGGFAVVALLSVLRTAENLGEVALAVAFMSGLLGLQYFYFGRPSTDLHSRRSYAMFAVQACLAYLPMVWFLESWVSLPVFLAGSALLVLPLPVAWPVFVAIVASTGIAQTVREPLDVVYVLVNSPTSGLMVYGMTRLARFVTALHEARDELAKTVVAHERLRFARNLHDLLGLSLSAIAPKGELTLRLVRRNPERAKHELAEILEISRRALADVRSTARVYRDISPDSLSDAETGTLVSMLAASNVELRVDLDLRELPSHTRTALSAVLREGVADVLRHREVERCEIVLGRRGDMVSVDILNVLDESVAADGAGGFDNLSETVSRMAGEVTVGVDADGRLRLHVTLPVTAPPERPAEAQDEPRTSIPHVATKLAGALAVAVFFGFFLQAVLRQLYLVYGFWDIAAGTACLLAALVLQLGYFSRPGTRLRSPTGYLLLGLLALVVYLPLLVFQQAYTGLPGFLAASALLVLRPVAGWSVFVAVVATVAWSWSQIGFGFVSAQETGLNVLLTVNNALITYGLTVMARTLRQLRAARREQAEVALAETRLRFARDLHDLLGLSLSAITLKSELAYRLILLDPAKARDELVEVLEIARRALADVRSVATGYHELSLEEECRTAESLLVAAELNVRMDVLAEADYGELPPDVSTVLATVLREGVTNVLRHSKGESCEITISRHEDEAVLHIVNDGVTKPSDSERWGSGIRNMSDRVAGLGGVFTAGFEEGGRFALQARVPVASGVLPATAS